MRGISKPALHRVYGGVHISHFICIFIGVHWATAYTAGALALIGAYVLLEGGDL